MKKNIGEIPEGIGSALKNVLLDATNEKFYEWAWDLFEQKPEVKKVLKATEREVYARLNDPKLKNALEQVVDEIRCEAEEFYLALGFLIGQRYAVHSPEVQKELGCLVTRMEEARILPLSTPIGPRSN